MPESEWKKAQAQLMPREVAHSDGFTRSLSSKTPLPPLSAHQPNLRLPFPRSASIQEQAEAPPEPASGPTTLAPSNGLLPHAAARPVPPTAALGPSGETARGVSDDQVAAYWQVPSLEEACPPIFRALLNRRSTCPPF